LLARIGGDEFLIWLEGVGADTASARAEGLLQHASRLAALSVVPDRPLGVSIGVAVYDGLAPVPLDRLVARADRAMYAAKSHHRSGYVIASPEEDVEEAPETPYATAAVHESRRGSS
jgi:diguanylate cyclase (GGDEF)-like protein